MGDGLGWKADNVFRGSFDQDAVGVVRLEADFAFGIRGIEDLNHFTWESAVIEEDSVADLDELAIGIVHGAKIAGQCAISNSRQRGFRFGNSRDRSQLMSRYLWAED